MVKLEEKGLVPKSCDVDTFCISIVYEVGLNDSRVAQLGIFRRHSFLIYSRRPVLEETPTRPARVNPLPIPPPPMPGAAPVPMHMQMPPPVDVPPPPAPGPTPAPVARTMPRIVAGGPITLPPGYVLPPGWAVIPAHNVQVIPPAAQTPAGVPNAQVVGQHDLPRVPHPPPGGNGDVTIPNPNDQVSQSSAERSPTTTNIPPTPTITSLPPNNSTTSNSTPPNLMQRPAPRVWATQSPHPSFPIAVPLFPTAGSMGVQYRSTTFPPATGRADGTLTSTQGQPQSPRVNGVTSSSNERDETEERMAILDQMGESVRAMQDLMTRMSTLIPSQMPPSTSSTVPLENVVPQSIISTSGPSNAVYEPSTSSSNGHTSDNSPSRTPPPLRIQRRRSFSPVDRTNENEPHPSDRLHRLSSSEDELPIEELADIRAPWVEQDIDVELPLAEVRHSRQGSPPRMRSASQSPSRSLRRRGSLLKHDITNEMLEERGRATRSVSMDSETKAGGLLDKGKGKEVYVEDGSEEE